jgi:hypothetical protein
MLAKVPEVDTVVEKFAGCSSEDSLATMCAGHDPRRAVHIQSDVLRRIQCWLAAVDADSHASLRLKVRHGIADGRDRGRSTLEGIEERVALVVDLIALVSGEGRSDSSAVVSECLSVAVFTQALKQPCRSFHVRENERDCSGRLHSQMIPRSGRFVTIRWGVGPAAGVMGF